MQIYPVLVSPAGMYCLQVSPGPDADIEAGVHSHQPVLAIETEAAEAKISVEGVRLCERSVCYTKPSLQSFQLSQGNFISNITLEHQLL